MRNERPKPYDLIAVGTGAAAMTVASQCRKAGWRVAVVDCRPFGGTCALRGCDPKKVLIAAAEALHWVHRLAGHGVDPGGLQIDWGDLMAFKRSFTEPVPAANDAWLREAGIDAFHGQARFVGPTALKVGDAELEARRIVVATGAVPAGLGIPGEEHLITSEAFLELDALPERVAFVGAGYISMEFAHIAARAGASVCVAHRSARPLVGFDPDLTGIVSEAARASSIDLMLETAVERVTRTPGGYAVDTSSPSGRRRLEADIVVHGAGRVADLDDLNLAAAGVERGKRGVCVNEFLQSTSNSAVYAAGDAAETAGLPLTPVAAIEGRVVAANLLNGNTSRPDYSGTPTVAFTLPPIAAVGLSEQDAHKQGLEFKVNFQDTSQWYSSRRVGEAHSASKVLVENGTGRILGAQLVGPSAEELINLFALAIRRDLTGEDMRDVIFAYPTLASDLGYMV